METTKFFREAQQFHVSNSSSSRFACSSVTQLPYHDRCSFIHNSTDCSRAVVYFDYMNFIFCTIGPHSASAYIIAIVLVAIACLYLFCVLATTADKFFCPALAVISKMLKMSENVAGVTLLAFGNGSPDIFASLATRNGDSELMYTELLGAAIFCTGVIAGLVMFMRPHKIVSHTYIRDVVFFMVSAIVIHNFMHDHKYSLTEGCVTIAIYIVYLVVVVLQHFQLRNKFEELKKQSVDSMDSDAMKDMQRQVEELEVATEIKIHSRRNSSVVMMDEDITKAFRQIFSDHENENLFSTFLQSIIPFEHSWRDAGNIRRSFMLLKTPVVFVLMLIIPVVDYSEDRHGWSKLLNMINIVTLPQLFLLVTGSTKTIFFSCLPLAVIVFLISLTVASIVYNTSRNDCPPKYHVAFAAGSFVGCVCVIYSVAKEVVSVMRAMGIISDLSDSMVGLLFLALGNSIGDLFSSISLARQGYQHMAFAACFGGPMFNSLLGVGATFVSTALSTSDGLASVREGAMGPNCIIFLTFIIFFPFLALCFTNFHARKSIGIYMIAIYAVFLLFALLGELEIMHPYGTDHQFT